MENNNKTVLLTGATSGFGKVIAEHLVKKNYTVYIFSRTKEKADNLAKTVKIKYPNSIIDYIICDLSSFQSIQLACEDIQKKITQIDLLILNAGLWNFDYKETKDGIEETFQVNLLAPILIFENLVKLIPKNNQSKVIFTSSGLHQNKIQFNDIQFKNKFSGFKSYRQSKLGIILITRLFSKNTHYKGISFFCVHPGVVNTELGKNANWFSRFIFKLIGKSLEKGAQTHIDLINKKNKELISGEYYQNSKVSKTTKEAHDMDEANKLYNLIKDYINPTKNKNFTER